MAKRPLSDERRRWLAEEAESWQERGLVSEQQRHDILDLYELPADAAARQRNRAIFILMSVAALLVGLALLLLVGYNWQEMPNAVKLALIFGVVAGLHGGGFYLRYQRDARLTSEILFFLGCFAYGIAIWLIAQIFNINAHWPDGFWWWAIGILPFALLLDTLLLHTLLALVLGIWVGAELIGSANVGFFFRRWGLPSACYTLPLLALPGLIWAYRRNSPMTVGLYVPLLAWWLVLQPLAWHVEQHLLFFMGSVGALLLLVGECHRPGSRFAIPFRAFGVLIGFGVLAALSFYELHREFFWSPERDYVPSAAILVFGLLTLIGVAVWQQRQGPSSPLEKPTLLVLLQRQWLPLGLLLLMALLSLWTAAFYRQGAAWAAIGPVVLVNLAMLAAAFWLMTLGLREERGRPFAAGVAYFLLWAVLRYIDLFGDWGGMLGAALMFFLCGAALFGVAVYWRKRKELAHD